MLPDKKYKNAVVLGAARSGLAAAELLQKNNISVFVSEKAESGRKLQEIELLKGLGIPFEFGGHTEKVYAADFIVLSPGIPQTSPAVAELQSRGIPVFSEIEVAFWFCRSPLIAVTGSNGKTTTTNLIGEMLKFADPQAIVAGNIGQPFSGEVLRSRENSWGVIEVSSFQLETIAQFHPRVAVILNLAPNHLDWYDTYEDYIAAKMRILKNLTAKDHLIYDADDSLLKQYIDSSPAQKSDFSAVNEDASSSLRQNGLYLGGQQLISLDQIKLFGKHNYKNAMAACLAASVCGIPAGAMSDVLRRFGGVEHRLEPVSDINGVKYINDSKATTLESLEAALNSFTQPLVLIAGGKDKGADFRRLRDLVHAHVIEAVLIGSAQQKIADAWKDIVPIYLAVDLTDAVQHATESAGSGGTVLLSPACSSFDMFTDFEDRGRKFKETVNKLKPAHAN